MIAANIIVYNEAERIQDCLERAADWADEIIIVDQSSTDSTKIVIAECAEFLDAAITVVNDKHWGFCEPSRQLAYDNTISEWIGVVDADEYFTLDFVDDIDKILSGELNNNGTKFFAARLQRSFWLAGNHRFTGDYQLRFFKRNAVEFLDQIHTEPQPRVAETYIYSTPYVALMHHKSWVEQIADEMRYKDIIEKSQDWNKAGKLALNVHLPLIEQVGLSAEEIDNLTHKERVDLGLDNA